MATESLIVELDARTAALEASLKRTQKDFEGLGGSANKTNKSFTSFSRAAKSVGGGLLKVATVVLAVNAAIGAMVLSSSKNRKELGILSRQAKTTAEDFQALSFATKQYGVNAEQIADISKDISDKVSEFSISGTGAFQDYVDTIKLTKDEAREVAKEFTTMSSQEVIGKMISEMESAGVSAGDMTFALESMGNDLSKLQPLFAKNSSELSRLKSRFKEVNDELSITGAQAKQLEEVSKSYELMTSQLGNASTAISATLAPVMDDFFNDVISVVPIATQTIIDFANSFLDAENISSIKASTKELVKSQERMIESKERLVSLEQQIEGLSGRAAFSLNAQISSEKKMIEQEVERTEGLKERIKVLKEQNQQIEDAKKLQGAEIGGENGLGVKNSGLGTGDQIQAIRDRFLSEESLLAEKFERELILIGDNNTLKLELEDEYINNLMAIDLKYEESKLNLDKKSAASKIKIDKDRQSTEQSLQRSNISSIMAITSALVGHNDTVGKALFVGSQALAASEVFFNTQVASARAIAELGPIAGPPVAAGIQASGQLSIASIAATTLGSLMSSSGGGKSGGGGGGSVEPPPQQNFQEETSSLSLTDSSSSGSNQNNFTFATDTGDELMDLIAAGLKKGQSEGRF